MKQVLNSSEKLDGNLFTFKIDEGGVKIEINPKLSIDNQAALQERLYKASAKLSGDETVLQGVYNTNNDGEI